MMLREGDEHQPPAKGRYATAVVLSGSDLSAIVVGMRVACARVLPTVAIADNSWGQVLGTSSGSLRDIQGTSR